MKNELIVSKFGGSSMADATCMLRSAQVALKHKGNIVVVSATYGTTNNLIQVAKLSQSGQWDDAEKLISEIKEKHLQIAADLKVNDHVVENLKGLFFELETLARGINLLRDLTNKAFDSIQALGERMSSLLFTEAMAQVATDNKVELLDVRKVLRTDNRFGKATPLPNDIRNLCEQYLTGLKSGTIYVTQGFIGATRDGETTTLGRGGSDYSAALVAEGVCADVLQIWTDVAGIATTDPRVVPEAKLLDEITFSEAAELATFGAKILHPTTLTPALRANVAVFVGSSYEAEKKGTWIKKSTTDAPLIRAMATRKEQALITLSTPKMLHAHGFLYEIFKIFNAHRVSVDSITTSEISVALTIDNATASNQDLLDELQELCDIKIEKDLSLVSLIGNNINHTSGLAARIFKSLGDINVRMICLGASKHNFCFAVDSQSADESIRRLHREFIS